MPIIPNPLIFGKPFHIWLGFLALALLLLQISVGKRWIKLPFWLHMKVIWIILLIVVLIHAFYGFQIYFLQ
jgi:hypothetical protein